MSRKSSIPKLNQVDSTDVMGQLLARQPAALPSFSPGQTVEGRVVEVGNRVLVLDIGAKSEGLVVEHEFDLASSFIKALKPGDKVSATIIVPETVNGQPLLSVKVSAQASGWKNLEAALKNKSDLEVKVESMSRGGLGVIYDGISGFIPTSQLSSFLAKNPEGAVEKNLKVKVTEVSAEGGRAVFSERAVSERELIVQQEEAIKTIKEGERFKGKVVGLVNFGAFVQIQKLLPGKKEPVELEGLVHLSEISWIKVTEPVKALREGQLVDVVVISQAKRLGKDDSGRLSLSIKRTTPDPWSAQTQNLVKDQQVKGKVVKSTDVGAFIEVAPGVEGLLRFNKIPDGVSLKVGETVNVFIEEIDQKNKKISLGMVLKAKPVGYK